MKRRINVGLVGLFSGLLFLQPVFGQDFGFRSQLKPVSWRKFTSRELLFTENGHGTVDIPEGTNVANIGVGGIANATEDTIATGAAFADIRKLKNWYPYSAPSSI